MSEIVENDNVGQEFETSQTTLGEQKLSVVSESSSDADVGQAIAKRPERRHRHPDVPKDKFYKMRQIFNVVFIIGAIIGVIVYLQNETMGAILIVTAMAFKMAECVIRFKK